MSNKKTNLNKSFDDIHVVINYQTCYGVLILANYQ